jgi:hypothetical protein
MVHQLCPAAAAIVWLMRLMPRPICPPNLCTRSRDASIFGPLSSSLEGRILSLMIETGPKVPLRSPTPARVLVDGSCDCSAARCWEVHVLARKGGYGLHSIPR